MRTHLEIYSIFQLDASLERRGARLPELRVM